MAAFLRDNSLSIHPAAPLTLKLKETSKIYKQSIGWDDPNDFTNTFRLLTFQNGKLHTLTERVFKTFDLATGKEEMSFEVGERRLSRGIPIFLKDHLLFFSRGVGVELWDIRKGTLLHAFPTEGSVSTIALNKEDDGLLELAVGLEDGRMQLWSPKIELAIKAQERARLEAAEQEATAAAVRAEQASAAPQPAQSGLAGRIFSALSGLSGWWYNTKK